jgi:asparagine synthetase B (glutamine-hydrolysing)
MSRSTAPSVEAGAESSRYAERWVAAPTARTSAGAWLDLRPAPVSGLLSVTHSARSSVVFEGELYNCLDLAETLRLPPSTSASGVIARAYDAWGVEFVHRLRGIFALVMHDGENDRTIGVRDALGATPLFYTEAGGRVLLSTSIEALREQPGVNRAFNRAALVDHLSHRWQDPHETFFASIRRVPPGYMLVSERGAVRVTRYWDPMPLDRSVDWLPEADVQAGFDTAFERAVHRTLEHGRIGIFLSGGLDSISVAAMAADGARRRGVPLPIGLSLGFPGDGSEEFEQRGVAARLGLEHEFVPFADAAPLSGLLSAALALTRVQAAPILNTWMPAYTSLALRGKQRGIGVITSGAGGDEWLAVSPFLAADLIRTGDLKGLAHLLVAWRRSYQQPAWRVARCLLWGFGARPLASAALGRLAPKAWNANRVTRGVRGLKPWISRDPKLRAEVNARIERLMPATNPAGGFYLNDVRATLEHPLVLLEREEIYEMGRRLDIRFLHPYWDAEVADILYRTPPLQLFADGRSKSVVRSAMARRFPGLGLEHQKKRASTTFYASVLDREIPQLWSRRPAFTELADLGIVDLTAVEEMGNTSVATNNGTGLVSIWDLLNVNMWLQAHQ